MVGAWFSSSVKKEEGEVEWRERARRRLLSRTDSSWERVAGRGLGAPGNSDSFKISFIAEETSGVEEEGSRGRLR